MDEITFEKCDTWYQLSINGKQIDGFSLWLLSDQTPYWVFACGQPFSVSEYYLDKVLAMYDLIEAYYKNV